MNEAVLCNQRRVRLLMERAAQMNIEGRSPCGDYHNPDFKSLNTVREERIKRRLAEE
jgi:hypothetical protein